MNTSIDLESLLKAGNIHKTIKQNILPMIVPGANIYDIANKISNLTRSLSNETINGGLPFPPNISINHIVAHHSPRKDNIEIINIDDNIKFDYGVHINGWIVDSAFTHSISNKHDIQNKATLEALMAGIKEIGIDAPVNNVTNAIQEIIESTEIEYNNKSYNLKLVNSLSGHGISQFELHGSPRIPNKITEFVNNNRFTEGIFAVEPLSCILNSAFTYSDNNNVYIHANDSRFNKLFKNFHFRYEDLLYYNIPPQDIEYYIKNKIILPEKDLVGTKGDIIAHFEHTVYIDEYKKILVT